MKTKRASTLTHSLLPFILAALLLTLPACTMPVVAPAVNVTPVYVTATPTAAFGGSMAGMTITISSQHRQLHYNGNCGPGNLYVAANVSVPEAEIQRVWMRYRYNGSAPNAVIDFHEQDLKPVGGGRYDTLLDVSNAANQEMAGTNGSLEYQIYVIDVAGNTQSEPNGSLLSVAVVNCANAQENASAPVSSGGSPAATPGGSSNGSSGNSGGGAPANPAGAPANPASGQTLVITSVVDDAESVYYGCVPDGVLTAVTVITPQDQIKTVSLEYEFTSQAGVFGSGSLQMQKENFGSYVVTVNISSEAAKAFVSKDGYFDYYVSAKDMNGGQTNSNVYSVPVNYCEVNVMAPPLADPPGGANSPLAPRIDSFVVPNSAEEGGSVKINWQTSYAFCGVKINDIQVSEDGMDDYQVPANAGGTQIQLVIKAYGGDCSSPQLATDTRFIKVSKVSKLYSATYELAPGDGIDLDGKGGNQDLYFYSDGSLDELRAYGSAQVLYWGPSGPPECGGGLSSDTVTIGSYYCYNTMEGNTGYLYVESMEYNKGFSGNVLRIQFTTDVQN